MPTNGVNPNMMDVGANGLLGQSTTWTAVSPDAILALPGSAYSPTLDVVAGAAGDTTFRIELTHECHSQAPGGASFCTPGCPCSEGQGDCDTNADCAGDLRCVQNNGAQFGFAASLDMCVRACHNWQTAGSATYCTPSCPCGDGLGDCDSDADCAGGLICIRQSGTDFCGKPT